MMMERKTYSAWNYILACLVHNLEHRIPQILSAPRISSHSLPVHTAFLPNLRFPSHPDKRLDHTKVGLMPSSGSGISMFDGLWVKAYCQYVEWLRIFLWKCGSRYYAMVHAQFLLFVCSLFQLLNTCWEVTESLTEIEEVTNEDISDFPAN